MRLTRIGSRDSRISRDSRCWSCCLLLSLALCFPGQRAVAQGLIGVFDGTTDVGHVQRVGSVTYNAPTQRYTIAGSGQNMWGTRDAFHFVFKRMTGDFILATRARFVGAGVEEHRKMGWTVRPSFAADAPHVTAAVHGNGLTSLQFRRSAAAETEEHKFSDSIPDPDVQIQLERRGGVFI